MHDTYFLSYQIVRGNRIPHLKYRASVDVGGGMRLCVRWALIAREDWRSGATREYLIGIYDEWEPRICL